MHFEQDYLPGELRTGESLYRAWRVQKPDAVIVLLHGLSEHSGSYDLLGQGLTSANIALYSFDLPGHGEEVPDSVSGDLSSWSDVTGSLSRFLGFVEQQEPRTPLFLLGSGMGGLIALERVWSSVTEELHGLILHNTWYPSSWLLRIISLSTRFQSGKKGNVWLRKRVLSLLNRAYQPAKTDYDWLSRNLETSIAYSDDPACDINLTNRLIRQYSAANRRINSMIKTISPKQPVPTLMLYGGDNPLTDDGLDGKRLASDLERIGLGVAQLKTFPTGRHQLLADPQQGLVAQKIVDWVTQIAGPFSEKSKPRRGKYFN